MTRDKRKWAARDNSTTAATMSDSEQPTQDVGAEASVEDAPPPAAGDGEAGSDAGSDVDNSALFGGSDSDDDDDGDAAAPSASAETGDAAGGEDAVGAGGGGSDDDEKLFGSDSDDDAAGGGSGSGSGSGSGAGAGAGAVVVDSDGNSDDGPNLVELPPPSGPRPLENPVNVRVLGEEVVPRPPEGALVQTVRLPSIVGIAPRHFDPECVVLPRRGVEQAPCSRNSHAPLLLACVRSVAGTRKQKRQRSQRWAEAVRRRLFVGGSSETRTAPSHAMLTGPS